jgi:PAS domain S-box-containing protein
MENDRSPRDHHHTSELHSQRLKQVTPDAYAATFEWAPMGMVLVDGEGEIVMFNAAAERMFGHLREDVTGKPVEILVPERVREQHRVFRQRYQKQPAARPMGSEFLGLRKDGVEFPVEIGLNPIETPGGTLVLSAIVEITERKHAEQRLRSAAADLARSNADLEQFAYAASHDLQEPLRMIAGFLHLLDKRLSERLDDESREYMNYALEGAERMRALIDALLAYSRVQTSSKPREIVPLRVPVEEALANLRFAIEESHADISCDSLPTVEADPVQMTLLFQNLIGNAIKFRGSQPLRIAVGVRGGAGDLVEITVADNGIGIEPRFAERIFGLFQRLHVREEYPGTGIGLAICKRIVERHGGTIRCESAPGNGATFVISLPHKALQWD